jgi:hypothetical protein
VSPSVTVQCGGLVSREFVSDVMARGRGSLTSSLLAKPLHCNTLHHNTRAHYFAYLSTYGHLTAEVTNCTPDDRPIDARNISRQ